jgi:hypothetical protein
LCVEPADLASVSPIVRSFSKSVRQTPSPVSANVRQKVPLIARRAIHHCAPLQLWKTGGTSGLVQKVVEIRIDDDHDAVWLRVAVAGGASCHVGYRSCLYRSVQAATDGSVRLAIVEERKVFEPMEVYGDVPNPTQL